MRLEPVTGCPHTPTRLATTPRPGRLIICQQIYPLRPYASIICRTNYMAVKTSHLFEQLNSDAQAPGLNSRRARSRSILMFDRFPKSRTRASCATYRRQISSVRSVDALSQIISSKSVKLSRGQHRGFFKRLRPVGYRHSDAGHGTGFHCLTLCVINVQKLRPFR
jgi:hypothetical protein